MTFRERLADWISGGALSVSRSACDGWERLYETQSFAQAERWREAYGEVELGWGKTQHDLESARQKLKQAIGGLVLIRDATADGKSGTAQKIHRMAKEALGE